MKNQKLLAESFNSLVFSFINADQQKCILKQYKSGLLQDARKEFLFLKTVESPGIVKALNYGIDETPFLITEFIDALSLAQKTQKEIEKLNPVTFMLHLSESISFVHSCGICINDLNPDNLLVEQDKPIIIDFGLASVNLYYENEFKGSFAFSAPEKILRYTNHYASDIFSLGMIYFFLINHKTILDYYDNQSYLNLLQNESLWTDSLNTLISDPFLKSMLAYHPAKRPNALEVFSFFNQNTNIDQAKYAELFLKSYLFKSQQTAVQKLWKKKSLHYQYADEPQKLENLLSLYSENESKKLIILEELLFVNNPDEFFKPFPLGYREKEVYQHKLIEYLLDQNCNILLKRSAKIKQTQLFNEITSKLDCLIMYEEDTSEVKNISSQEINDLLSLLKIKLPANQTLSQQIKENKAFFVRLILLKSLSSDYIKSTYNELVLFLHWINLPLPLSLIESVWENWFVLIQDALLSQKLIVEGDLIKSNPSIKDDSMITQELLQLILSKLKNTSYHFVLGRFYLLLNDKENAFNHWNMHLDYLIRQEYFMSAYEFLCDLSMSIDLKKESFELRKKYAFVARIVGKFEESLDKYQELINESDGVLKAVLSCDLAIVLQALKRNEDAIDIYKKAIDLFRLHKDWKSLFRAMNNLGVVYFGLKKYTDAESLFNDVLLQAKILNNLQFETISYLNLADINCKRGEWKKALFHAEKAIIISESNNKWNLIANGKIISAKCLFAQGEYEKAINTLEFMLAQPQSKENQLTLQEILAWMIHFKIHISFNEVDDFIEQWNLPSPEMHEILIRELFFYFYLKKAYLKANQMLLRLPDNKIFSAFLDSDYSVIEQRLKELKIQNENDSFLYYLTYLLRMNHISPNQEALNDFKDDIKLFDYKPAELCCRNQYINSDFQVYAQLIELFETTHDDMTLLDFVLKELIRLFGFERIACFDIQGASLSPILIYDQFNRKIDPDKTNFSQSIMKQILSKKGVIYEQFLLNSELFTVNSSMIGLGLTSVFAYHIHINTETSYLIYADSKKQIELLPHELKTIESIVLLLKNLLEKQNMKNNNDDHIQLNSHDEMTNNNWQIIGNSKVMEDVFNKIRMVAAYNVNVLITGPTGSGKELVSRAIHQLYTEKNINSKKAPFVAVNCAAIPEQLLESELFGYKRGAFTGAVNDQKGKILEANYGTLFLDEIGEMPLILQAKLLRVIQDKEVTPLGTSHTIPVTVRIITATNRNLEDQVEQGLFRADLFYRLKVMNIHLPGLDERREDIPLLVMHFLKKFNQKFSKNITSIQPKTMQFLQKKDWKGNIRELENEIERAVLMCQKDFLSMDDLLESIQDDTVNDYNHLPIKWNEFKDYKQKINDELDTKYVKQLLDNADSNVSLASKIGNLDRVQIYRLLKNKE